MTALSGLMIFLVTIIIILHFNIDLCSGFGTRTKYFLVEAKAKNASLVNHASLGRRRTMDNGFRQRKVKKSETGLDYQESTTSMYNEATQPAADPSKAVHYCR